MPPQRLIQCEFVAVGASRTAMIGPQTHEHLTVDLGVQDALDDHVKTMLERESRGQFHVGDAQSFRMITDMKDLATQHVVPDDRDAPWPSGPDGFGQARLPLPELPRMMISREPSEPTSVESAPLMPTEEA